MKQQITLDFGTATVEAELFDTTVANELYERLPISIELITWGDEAYGPLFCDLGEGELHAEIPPGGIAYTRQGNYLCLFYGQRPAWPVEYVGKIVGDWRQLLDIDMVRVTIEKGQSTDENR